MNTGRTSTNQRGTAAEVLALARDGQFDLHDAHPVDIDIDVPWRPVRIVADASTPAGEWHRLALLFEGAAVVPDNFQRLAFAVGAAFRKTGPFGPTTTVIHYQELDIAADGRYVLRLRLWPFHEFEVWFRRMTSTDAPVDRPGGRSRGDMSIVPSRDIDLR